MEVSDEVNPIFADFPTVIRIIFHNWTALRMAVEHGMAGPHAHLKVNALVDTVLQYFSSGSDWDELADVMADMMDSQFNTILEDGSHDEVAKHLCELRQKFVSGDLQGLRSSLTSLPIQTPFCDFQVRSRQEASSAQSEEETENSRSGDEMDEPPDDGWTVVKRK